MTKAHSNTVRIIGGIWRGRRVRFRNAPGVRPTPDRVRETVFNWLGQDLSGWRCLDLFAGSGAMGFEAASRGAASVVMVERSALVARALRENAKILDARACEIRCCDALEFLSGFEAGNPFDVVFLDPPFSEGWLEKVLQRIPVVLTPLSVVYAESEARLPLHEDWEKLKEGRAGAVHYALVRRREKESQP